MSCCRRSAACRNLARHVILLLLLAVIRPLSLGSGSLAGSFFARAEGSATPSQSQERSLSTSATLSGRVVAYGDTNLDGSTDVITIRGSNLYAHVWTKENKFNINSLRSILAGETFLSAVVLHKPFDNPNTKNSTILITTEISKKVKVVLYDPEKRSTTVVVENLEYEPTLVSLTGIRGPALLVRSLNGNLTLIPVFKAADKFTSAEASYSKIGNLDTIGSSSDAYLDLNGDCAPEYFIVSENYTKFHILGIKCDATKNSLEVTNYLEKNLEKNIVSYISFIDITASGKLDIVYVTCENKNCQIKALMNTAHARSPESIGRRENVCESSTTKNEFSAESQVLYTFSETDRKVGDRYRLVITDFDKDLHSDILVAINGKFTVLLNQYSKDQNKNKDGQSKSQSNNYFISANFKYDFTINKAKSVSYFLNIGDNVGKLVIATDDETVLIDKKYDEDTFSISSCIFWPECTVHSCPGISGVIAGGNIRILVRNSGGEDKIVHLPQGAQAASQSLQLPCISTGLGRVNNFLPRISISGGQLPPTEFSEIIPNSALIATHDQHSAWNLSMRLNANDHALKVTIASVIVIMILLILSGFLTWMEKREDERQRMYWI